MTSKELNRLLDKAKKQNEDGEVIECIGTLNLVIDKLNDDAEKEMEE